MIIRRYEVQVGFEYEDGCVDWLSSSKRFSKKQNAIDYEELVHQVFTHSKLTSFHTRMIDRKIR